MVLHGPDVGPAAIVARGHGTDVGAPCGMVAHGVGRIHHGVGVVGFKRGGPTVEGGIAAGRHARVLGGVDKARIAVVGTAGKGVLQVVLPFAQRIATKLRAELRRPAVEHAVAARHARRVACERRQTILYAAAILGIGIVDGAVHVGEEDGVGIGLLGVCALEITHIAHVAQEVALVEGEVGRTFRIDDAVEVRRGVVVDDAVHKRHLTGPGGKDGCALLCCASGNKRIAHRHVCTVGEDHAAAVLVNIGEQGRRGVGIVHLKSIEHHIGTAVEGHEVGHVDVKIVGHLAGDDRGITQRITLIERAVDGGCQIGSCQFIGIPAIEVHITGHVDGHHAQTAVDIRIGIIVRSLFHVDIHGHARKRRGIVLHILQGIAEITDGGVPA